MKYVHSALLALAIAAPLSCAAQLSAKENSSETIWYRPIEADATLKGTVTRWANLAGLRADWRAPDYPLTQRAVSLVPQRDLVEALKRLSVVYAKVATPFTVRVEQGSLIVESANSSTPQSTGEKVASPAQPPSAEAIVPEKATPPQSEARMSTTQSAEQPKQPATSASATVSHKAISPQPEKKLGTAAPGGQPSQAATTKTAPLPEETWEIRKADGSVYGSLKRWAETAKPQRQLIWDTEGNDFQADPEAIYTGDFDTAILEVMRSLQNSRYPVRACMWDNKPRPVVKIIHKNKRCQD